MDPAASGADQAVVNRPGEADATGDRRLSNQGCDRVYGARDNARHTGSIKVTERCKEVVRNGFRYGN